MGFVCCDVVVGLLVVCLGVVLVMLWVVCIMVIVVGVDIILFLLVGWWFMWWGNLWRWDRFSLVCRLVVGCLGCGVIVVI